MQRVFGLNNT